MDSPEPQPGPETKPQDGAVTPSQYDKPDWSTQRKELRCPLCDYNLFGLDQPRCPECGYQFEWADLLDPKRRVHAYLFEHHPRRNVRSFVLTLQNGLMPRQFWTYLSAAMSPRPERLRVYWLWVAVIVCALTLAECYLLLPWNETRPPQEPLSTKLRYWADRGLHYPLLRAATLLAWPWATLLTLLIFRASMRRAKVKTEHVLRCVVYSGDVAFWAALVLLAAAALGRGQDGPWVPFHSGTFVDYFPALVLLLALCVAACRLGTAYHRYLHFEHAWATALSAQGIVVLFLMTVWVWLWILIPTEY